MVWTKRISYYYTDFASTTPMKTTGLRAFVALTFTSATKDLFPGSRGADSMAENHLMHACTTERILFCLLALSFS